MATEVTIPAMASISSGILAAWHVNDGDFVEAGQAIFEPKPTRSHPRQTPKSRVISIQIEADEEVEIG